MVSCSIVTSVLLCPLTFLETSMTAKSNFFGTGFFYSDIEQEESEMKHISPVVYEQAQNLYGKMVRIYSVKLPNSKVFGKFLLKKDGSTEYMCSLFEQGDYERRMKRKEKYPILYSFIQFFFGEPELATATLTWSRKNKNIPVLDFHSVSFSPLQEKIKTELVKTLG